jgi:hypothetical protein
MIFDKSFESTIGIDDHFGYVVWPLVIMVYITAECVPPHPIRQSVSALQVHWISEKCGFAHGSSLQEMLTFF